MNVKKNESKPADNIPDVVVDSGTKTKYLKGKFMGKGGFAKCYELQEFETNKIFAGKVVSKDLLIKPHQKEKMSQEIAIHKSISHKHIVKFHGFFEDIYNVYILLELCRRRSLMELQRRRKTVTEPEARYFIHQITVACHYLHQKHIIHRDLKLGNLFLNDEMEVKIGDFGLATRIDKDGERKKTLCGTPNYIAPEILNKKGHSYEVDAWSLGCILYTLLIGKPPFETSNLKDTYARIKHNEYYIPPDKCSTEAKNLIQKLLQLEPTRRPTMAQVLKDDFLVTGFMPLGLPTSCLTTSPHISTLKEKASDRNPLKEVNEPISDCSPMWVDAPEDGAKGGSKKNQGASNNENEPGDYYLSDLMKLLSNVNTLNTNQRDPNFMIDESEDPAAVPIYWVSKWVDYSDKYGLGYQLCDNSIGVLFNDSTRLILSNNGENIQYIEKDGQEHFHTLMHYPQTLQSLVKKVTLLKYFRNYMSEHLLKAGSNITPRDGDDMSRLPFLRTWFRTRSAIVLHLSNGTLQINFFHDHTKIILCPLMLAVTYIDETQSVHTYRIPLLHAYGCSQSLTTRLRYAKTMVEKLTSGSSGRLPANII